MKHLGRGAFFLCIVQHSIFSATGVKAIVFIVDYQKFQKWVSGMLSQDKGKKVVIIDIFAGIFGLILIVLSVCVVIGGIHGEKNGIYWFCIY